MSPKYLRNIIQSTTRRCAARSVNSTPLVRVITPLVRVNNNYLLTLSSLL